MKRFFLIFLALLLVASPAYAKKKKRKAAKVPYKQGQKAVMVGLGFPAIGVPSSSAYAVYGDVKTTQSTQFMGAFDFAATNHIGIGMMLSHYSYSVTVSDPLDPININGFNYSFTTFGIQGGFHLFGLKKKAKPNPKLDAYANVILGFRSASAKAFGPNNIFEPGKGGAVFGGYVGASYMFALDMIGIFAEVGYGSSNCNVGLKIKF